MPDRLRAAFNPARLGGYRSGGVADLLLKKAGKRSMHQLIANCKARLQGQRPGAGRPDKTRGAIGFVLIFCFFLIKQKEIEEG